MMGYVERALFALELDKWDTTSPMCEINYKWENNFFLIVEFVARHLNI